MDIVGNNNLLRSWRGGEGGAGEGEGQESEESSTGHHGGNRRSEVRHGGDVVSLKCPLQPVAEEREHRKPDHRPP
jgi:hypothetical protein